MPKSKLLIFIISVSALLITSIDSSIVAVAFPVFTSEFDTSIVLAGWTMTGYQLVLIAASPVAAKLSDVWGRKFTFILWVGIFTFASLLCSLAPNVEWLIGFRIIQGIGAAGIMPAVIGILAATFPESRQRAIGLLSSIVPSGMIIGPNLGGFMISVLSWRSLFWINIPLGILILIGAILLLKRDKGEMGKIDYTGAGMIAVTLAGFMVGLSLISTADTPAKWMLVGTLFAVAIVAGVIFFRHEQRVTDPIVDLDLMKRRPFIASNIFNFFFGWVVGFMSLIPAYAVYVYGMTTLESGIMLTPRSIGMMAASAVASHFIVRSGYRRPLIIGSVMLATGSLLLALEPRGLSIFGVGISNMASMIFIVSIFGIGSGITAPAANNACIELMPQRVSTITGLMGIFRMSGTTVGLTVSTLLLHNAGTDRGFLIILVGMAVLILANIASVVNMPASAADRLTSNPIKK